MPTDRSLHNGLVVPGQCTNQTTPELDLTGYQNNIVKKTPNHIDNGFQNWVFEFTPKLDSNPPPISTPCAKLLRSRLRGVPSVNEAADTVRLA
jgi:hypothetical protein